MPNPYIYDNDGYRLGAWDKTNGTLETDFGPDLQVDSDGYVYDESGNLLGQINSQGRLS